MKKNQSNFKLNEKNVILTAFNTLLSFVRTSLVCLSVAFAFMKLDKANPIDAFTISMFVLAGIVLIWGIIIFIQAKIFCKKQEKNSN